MPIPDHTKLGGYEIESKLGKGGMGEVYRARDEKLGRAVAIKVLPEAFTQDEARLRRFEREARLLAALSHPNIAAIYGLEHDGDQTFLVLELAEGQTLRERMRAGPMPLAEALNVFQQIATALEVAHDKGIIHRDLKPENVAITPERVAKVLDFGLAKHFEESAGEDEESPEDLRTATFHSTAPGMVLGTIPYMSPEQARGQELDRRTDIWSFGCCLWEALAGRHPFQADTASDILASVLQREPDWDALPKDTPPVIIALLRRCLHKDPHDRLHDIADARIELGDAIAIHSGPTRAMYSPPPRTRSKLWYGAAAAAIVAAALIVWPPPPPPPRAPTLRVGLELPATAPLDLGAGRSLSLTPDGSRLYYAGRRGETSQIFERRLAQRTPTPLPGTEGAETPVASPNGQWVAFFSDGGLKRAPSDGGPPLEVADAPGQRGAAWLGDDRIVFAPNPSGGLVVVPATGGDSETLTTLDQERGEESHRWPSALPGEDAVLFTSWRRDGVDDIELVSVSSGERETLLDNASDARYVPTGHIVFTRDGSLFAARFDARRRRVENNAVLLTSDVGVDPRTGAASYALDDGRLLVYAPPVPEPPDGGLSALLFVDRQGHATRVTETDRAYSLPRLSPDGRRLLVTIDDGAQTDLWVLEIDRGTLTRVTFEGNNAAGIWTPDQERIVFSSDRSGIFNLYEKSSDGSGEATRLTTGGFPQMSNSLSPDGNKLAYTEFNITTGTDLWVSNLADGASEAIANTSEHETGAMFSPDGSFVAYVSDESGRNEVYVRGVPDGGKWQISVDGGSEPVWSPKDRELFFRNRGWMVAVSVQIEPSFVASRPTLLFEIPYVDEEASYSNYHVTRDGRFLMVQSALESTATRLGVVMNWVEALEP